MRYIFVVIFLQLLEIFAESDEYCRVCPGYNPKTDPDPPCYCHPLYYDRQTETCVPRHACPLAAPPEAEPEAFGFDQVADIISRIGAGESRSADVVKSKEVGLVEKALRSNLEVAVEQNLAKLSTVANPYIMSNRRLSSKCKDNKLCMLISVLGKNDKVITKYVADLVPAWIDALIATVDDLVEAEAEECDVSECMSLRVLTTHRDQVVDILKHMKDFNGEIADKVVKQILKLREENGSKRS